MKGTDINIRFNTYLTECRKHINIIKKGLSELEECFPLSEKIYIFSWVPEKKLHY